MAAPSQIAVALCGKNTIIVAASRLPLRFIVIITEARTFSSARVTENSLMKQKVPQYTDVNTAASGLLMCSLPLTDAVKMRLPKENSSPTYTKTKRKRRESTVTLYTSGYLAVCFVFSAVGVLSPLAILHCTTSWKFYCIVGKSQQ